MANPDQRAKTRRRVNAGLVLGVVSLIGLVSRIRLKTILKPRTLGPAHGDPGFSAGVDSMKSIVSGYQRFCEERFLLPSEAQVAALERRMGMTFPVKYRRYLLTYNGGFFTEPDIVPPKNGCPEDCLRDMYGIGASHPRAELGQDWQLALFDENDPPKILPIGYTLMGGLILLCMPPGEGTGAILYKKPSGGFYPLASDINDFFRLLREPTDENSSPREEQGTRRQ